MTQYLCYTCTLRNGSVFCSTSFDESSFDRFYQEQGIAGLDDEAEDDKDQIHLWLIL
jgi:hypothetical protein